MVKMRRVHWDTMKVMIEVLRNKWLGSTYKTVIENGLTVVVKRMSDVRSETLVNAEYTGSSWDDGDPSVFKMTIVNTLQGDFQITNGYGPDKAPEVIQDHWNTYITEEDFNFISANGLSAVRIPVGWWIAQDPTPPPPLLEALQKQ
ncbi:Detected protein of unknown function [Hibiscus syriacus]|uniref:Uncharacterized protein n=1 Tax=Hibiscus syriacus TaxID=106335 RepID=A0A6A3B2G9_HIBSY|nr:Detected protein of unknown function [Hibiscus syriacus]